MTTPQHRALIALPGCEYHHRRHAACSPQTCTRRACTRCTHTNRSPHVMVLTSLASSAGHAQRITLASYPVHWCAVRECGARSLISLDAVLLLSLSFSLGFRFYVTLSDRLISGRKSVETLERSFALRGRLFYCVSTNNSDRLFREAV